MIKSETYYGLVVVIVFPSLLWTNSLFTNSPTGWVHVLPLGAVSSVNSFVLNPTEPLNLRTEMLRRLRRTRLGVTRP